MTDTDLTPLDPRFPIRLSQPPVLFWQMTRERPDRIAVIGEAARAREQERRQSVEERFVAAQTEPIPRVHASLPDDFEARFEGWFRAAGQASHARGGWVRRAITSTITKITEGGDSELA